MVITKTPFRISFFGGGSDIEEYFKVYGGNVLSTTIDKYCYVTVRHLPHFFDYSTELSYSKIERINDIDLIEHPAIRNAMKMLDMHDIRLTYEADLPARSGLGTSSSFAVGMLNAFYCLKGKYVDKKRLADDAIYLERILCGESGGWQDQIATSFGGMNRIYFNSNGYSVKPLIVHPERKKALQENLYLFFTGFTRTSSELHKINQIFSNVEIIKELSNIVNEAEKILVDKSTDLNEFGRLLDYSWTLKKRTGKSISTDIIDVIYKKGKDAGALGGKLLGAGGGGFLLFYCEREYKECLFRAMKDVMYVPFMFESEGACTIHYTPETWTKSE